MAISLDLAISAIRSGRTDEGRQLLNLLIQQNPNDEKAWLWMSSVVNADDQRARCLYHVLAIDPNSEIARRGLEVLGIVVSDSRPVRIPRDSQPIKITRPAPPPVAQPERRPFLIDPQTITRELPFTPLRSPFAEPVQTDPATLQTNETQGQAGSPARPGAEVQAGAPTQIVENGTVAAAETPIESAQPAQQVDLSSKPKAVVHSGITQKMVVQPAAENGLLAGLADSAASESEEQAQGSTPLPLIVTAEETQVLMPLPSSVPNSQEPASIAAALQPQHSPEAESVTQGSQSESQHPSQPVPVGQTTRLQSPAEPIPVVQTGLPQQPSEPVPVVQTPRLQHPSEPVPIVQGPQSQSQHPSQPLPVVQTPKVQHPSKPVPVIQPLHLQHPSEPVPVVPFQALPPTEPLQPGGSNLATPLPGQLPVPGAAVPNGQSYQPSSQPVITQVPNDTRPSQPVQVNFTSPQFDMSQNSPGSYYSSSPQISTNHANETLGMAIQQSQQYRNPQLAPSAIHSNSTMGMPLSGYNGQLQHPSEPVPAIHSNSTVGMMAYGQPSTPMNDLAIHSQATAMMPSMSDFEARARLATGQAIPTANATAMALQSQYNPSAMPPMDNLNHLLEDEDEEGGEEVNVLAVIIFGTLSVTALGGLGMLILLMVTAPVA